MEQLQPQARAQGQGNRCGGQGLRAFHPNSRFGGEFRPFCFFACLNSLVNNSSRLIYQWRWTGTCFAVFLVAVTGLIFYVYASCCVLAWLHLPHLPQTTTCSPHFLSARQKTNQGRFFFLLVIGRMDIWYHTAPLFFKLCLYILWCLFCSVCPVFFCVCTGLRPDKGVVSIRT